MEAKDNRVRAYCKVSKSKQEELLNLVYKDECRINYAADLLNINYATAKNIVLKFKKTHILRKSANMSESKRCNYKLIGESKDQTNSVNLRGGLVAEGLKKFVQKF